MPINASKEYIPGDHTARTVGKIAPLETAAAFAASWNQPSLFASASFIKNLQWEKDRCIFLPLKCS